MPQQMGTIGTYIEYIRRDTRNLWDKNVRPLINPTLQRFGVTSLTDMNDTDWPNVTLYQKTDRQIGVFVIIALIWMYFFILVASCLVIWGVARYLGITAEDLERKAKKNA